MTTISFTRHQFPPDIIRHAVWRYLRFTLSFRDVEDLLAERGLDLSYETIRRWVSICRASAFFPLKVKAVLRAMTKEPLRRERSVVRFSVIPPAK